LRKNWRPYAAVFLGLFVLTIIVAALMPTSFLKGFVVGAMLVGGASAVWSWTVQATGTAPTMMGDVAEQWTAAELRKLRAQGWRIVNHFVLATDDIDHVLIGPGGLYIVETKWSASRWGSDFGQSRLESAIGQATANARRIHLWQPVKSLQVPVHAVVVLWGGAAEDLLDDEPVQHAGGVTIVTGRALSSWIRGLPTTGLREDQVEGVWHALDQQVTRRDPLDQATRPVPASVEEMLIRCAIAVGFGVAGVLCFGQLVRFTHSTAIVFAVGVALLVPGIVLARAGSLKLAAWGWTTGLGLPMAALAIAQLIYQFSG
jgi:hypothetical protein